MSISLKGRTAIDAAKEAMRKKTEIEIFGLRYVVIEVSTSETSVSECLNGSADLLCLTRHSDVSGK